MRIAAALAVVLAGLLACEGGYSNGPSRVGDSGVPFGSSDGGDGGLDGGDGGLDGGDGGLDGGDAGPDAGCAALTLNGVPARDNCSAGGALTSATGTVNTANCTIDISFPTATGTCSGRVSGGTANAFDGGCQGGLTNCTSPSLPGTLTCVYGTTTCTIRICDAGTACP